MLANNRTIAPGSALVQRAAAAMALCAVVLCMCMQVVPASASQADTSVGTDNPATFCVVAVDGEGPDAARVKGMEFAAYKVAKMGASGGYQVLETFSAVDANYDDEMSVAEMKALAQKLAAIVSNVEPDAKAVTDDEGRAELGQLDYGVYLVVQTGATGDAVGYTTSDPYLINVPQFNADGTITYDVEAYPKFKKLSEESSTVEETKSATTEKATSTTTTAAKTASPAASWSTTAAGVSTPRTGDDTQGMVVVGCAVAGLALVVLAVVSRYRSRSA